MANDWWEIVAGKISKDGKDHIGIINFRICKYILTCKQGGLMFWLLQMFEFINLC